jgi:predicted transcriptional regulator
MTTRRRKKAPEADLLVTRAAAKEAVRHRVLDMRARMEAISLGQRALAARIGIHQPHINRVLCGKVEVPTYWTLLKMERGIAHFERVVATQRRKA